MLSLCNFYDIYFKALLPAVPLKVFNFRINRFYIKLQVCQVSIFVYLLLYFQDYKFC